MSETKKSKRGPLVRPFMTAHKLAFEVVPWERSDEYLLFRVGTCHGTWRSTALHYDILTIINEEPGNGHLQDVLQWFSHSCRRDGKDLRILEVMNKEFMRHLVEKRGFIAAGEHCIKKFT